MRNTVSAILLLFGTFVIGLIYLKPEWEAFKELRERAAELYTIKSELEDLTAARDALRDKMTAVTEEETARLSQSMPNGSDAIGLLPLLEYFSGRAGVKLVNIQFDAPGGRGTAQKPSVPKPGNTVTTTTERQRTAKELPLQLSIAGPYEAMKNFLGSIEKSLRLIDISGFSFAGGSEKDFSSNIRAKTYYQE